MENDPLVQLADRLTELRLKRGWNVKELVARCAPLSRGTISKALNAGSGGKVPTADTVVRICRALGADSAPLLELVRQAREDRRTPPPGPRAEDRSRQFTREPEVEPDGTGGAFALFNPLRRENLERAVQWALESAPPVPLVSFPEAPIDGLYALYYTGPHPLYRPVSSPACTVPVYVGTARPGWNSRGQMGLRGRMGRRLEQYRKSLDEVEDLDAQDFQVRYLPVEEIWMDGPERLMLGDHRPVWNIVVRGLGVHPQGAGTRAGPRTQWDELHPGRSRSKGQGVARLSRAELRQAVQQHFARTAKA